MKDLIRTRPPNQHPFSEDNVQWIRNCLQNCRRNHARCNKYRQEAQSLRQPRYLLDLGFDVDGQVRLVKLGKIKDFTILSYCWGEKPHYKTTSKNIQGHLAGFPLENLPKTIRDAIKVTLALGLRYLWVDALCILQDQDDQIIQNEVRIAHEFYSRGTVVIGAASASHSNAGFLASQDLSYREYELPIALKGGDTLLERAFDKKPEPMDERAWMFPEAKNALCILRFESERVAWECQETKLADSDVDELSTSDEICFSTSPFAGSRFMRRNTGVDDPEMHLANWFKLVIDYSARQTGRLADKLLPFDCIAPFMAKTIGWDLSEYKAGLWMRDMPRQLLWCRNCHHENTDTTSSPSDTTLTPSWSWAKIRSPIAWLDLNQLDWDDYTLEVVSCVRGRQLIVKGYVLDTFWDGQKMIPATSRDEADRAWRAASGPAARSRSRSPSGTHHADIQCHQWAQYSPCPIKVFWDEPLRPMRQKVRCLEIRSSVNTTDRSYGIVLTCDGSSTSKRLGYFEFQHKEMDWNWLHQKRRRTIFIN
ncbi:hypothetical protein CKAH01_16757 [Colletotrichum kahawae]|uniref:Heterokaryon incompatibility domain-containing protein n=1 Tax=Colletotrichum kahawae TaxID=34407 RepID=A0AAD9YEP9_COLKA|nr:hypothetical protein CKAH01_16757 [Colletotrichum kahawae]